MWNAARQLAEILEVIRLFGYQSVHYVQYMDYLEVYASFQFSINASLLKFMDNCCFHNVPKVILYTSTLIYSA
jgi:hypothetical protein